MTRSRIFIGIAAALCLVGTAACGERQLSQREIQAQQGQEKANQLNFTDNAEQANIERRLRLTAQPGMIGYIVLMNQAGQPIMYTAVRGKVSSSGKRLTPPDMLRNYGSATYNVGPGPSDEGTWGSSDPYIYFWTVDGQYMQWNGPYLYSNSPIRLSVQPLVVEIGRPSAPEPAAPAPSAAPAGNTSANAQQPDG